MEEKRLQIIADGILPIGEMEIPCYVLEDEQRIVSARGLQNVLKLVYDFLRYVVKHRHLVGVKTSNKVDKSQMTCKHRGLQQEL